MILVPSITSRYYSQSNKQSWCFSLTIKVWKCTKSKFARHWIGKLIFISVTKRTGKVFEIRKLLQFVLIYPQVTTISIGLLYFEHTLCRSGLTAPVNTWFHNTIIIILIIGRANLIYIKHIWMWTWWSLCALNNQFVKMHGNFVWINQCAIISFTNSL